MVRRLTVMRSGSMRAEPAPRRLYTGPIDIKGIRNAPALDSISWYGGNCGVDFDLAEGFNLDWPEKQYEFDTGGTREVGMKRANPWGLHDMLGNVYEWCDDGGRYYTKESAQDPHGRSTASASRVVRGGSWNSCVQLVRR